MILIIDNYDSFTYNLYQHVAQQYPCVQVIRNDQISVEQVKALNPKGIIISPGPGRPENAGICVNLIQSCYSQFPILGICLGHQAIAIAFGGKIISAPEIVHGKSSHIFHHRMSLYQSLPSPFVGGRYHSLIAEKDNLPESLKIDAVDAKGLIMGLSHRIYPLYGVQFHPESLLSDYGNQLLENFIQCCMNDSRRVQ